MKQSPSQKLNGIRGTSQSQLDDLDFADDMALLPHTQQQMQEKTNNVADRGKSKILKVSSTSTVSVILGVEAIEESTISLFWAASLYTQGGTEADVKTRIGKARVAFLQLNNI